MDAEIMKVGFAASLLGGFLGAIFGIVLHQAVMDVGESILDLARRMLKTNRPGA